MVDCFPPVSELTNLNPEEIGPFLLEYLNMIDNDPARSTLNRYNFTLETNPELREYAQEQLYQVARVLTEAWVWLEKEGFLAPMPNQTGDFVFITRKGKKFKNSTNFDSYKYSTLFPVENLDPILAQKVKPLFSRGDYDTAIFQAYKEVEVRLRRAGKYGDEIIGVDLARKAFNPEDGPLTDKSRVKSERESLMHLFSGALGSFKNPGSHRDVDFENPAEVADIILFANYLLRIIDSRLPEVSIESEQALGAFGY